MTKSEFFCRLGLPITVLLLILPTATFSQSNVIGRVVDSKTKKPVKDAVVRIEGKAVETATNSLGFFQVMADSMQNLIILHEEYEPAKIKVPGTPRFQVGLISYNAPDYEGGIEEFYKKFAQEMSYPAQARRMGFEGTTYISFDVDSLKGIQNIFVLYDPSNKLNVSADVIHALQKVPNKWIPKTAVVTMILPVKFVLVINEPPAPENFVVPRGKLLKEIIVTMRGRLPK